MYFWTKKYSNETAVHQTGLSSTRLSGLPVGLENSAK